MKNNYGKRLNGRAKGNRIIYIHGNTIFINRGIHQEQEYDRIENELTWEEIRRNIYAMSGYIATKSAEVETVLESPAELSLQQIVDLGNMLKSLDRKLDRIENFQEDIKGRYNSGEIKTWKDVDALKKVYKIL